jgi:hypothetical protein
MKWDGIRHHTGVGKGALSLIHRPSARTAREYARPTLGDRYSTYHGLLVESVVRIFVSFNSLNELVLVFSYH